MSDRRFDPVGHVEIETAKLGAAVAEFQARSISDDVFRASLFARGFRGSALMTEFSYQWDERFRKEQRP